MQREERQKLYDQAAQAILSSYEQIRGIGVDSDLVGEHGETIVHRWMREWLPTRIEPKRGAVLSRNAPPTNQMDCVLFDRHYSPVYYRINTLEVMPIEGIVGAVEVNSGLNTTYQKVEHDCQKLQRLANLVSDRLARLPALLSHVPFQRGIDGLTRDDLLRDLQYHQEHMGKPILLLYLEDAQGSLKELATRVATHNHNVGLRDSVDGVFVLKKGFALHRNPDGRGWMTQRAVGSDFAILETSPGQVLFKFQSVILKFLSQVQRSYPAGFDDYVSPEGSAAKEMATAMPVSGSAYAKATDPELVLAY